MTQFLWGHHPFGRKGRVAANQGMVLLYWDLGRMILDRQERQGWGAKVIDRLAADLREAFPGMQGFSPRKLLLMLSFAGAYPDLEMVKQVVSQLPWGHIPAFDGPPVAGCRPPRGGQA